MYSLTTHHGLEFLTCNQRCVSIRGQVDRLPIMEIHNFLLNGLAPEDLKCYLEDVSDTLQGIPQNLVSDDVCDFDSCHIQKRSVPSLTYDQMFQNYKLITIFLQIVSTYVQTSVQVMTTNKYENSTCTRCLIPFRQDEDEYICDHCQIVIPVPQDTKAVVPSIINVDQEMMNMEHVLELLEGRETLDPDEMRLVFKTLDDEFEKMKVAPRYIVMTQPVLRNGGKENTSRELMQKALGKNLKHMLPHINRLCADYWGWRLPDYTAYHENLRINHRRFLSVIDDVLRERGRQSNILDWIQVYKGLQILGAPLNIDDFRIVKTSTVTPTHLEIWVEGCRRAGLPQILTM